MTLVPTPNRAPGTPALLAPGNRFSTAALVALWGGGGACLFLGHAAVGAILIITGVATGIWRVLAKKLAETTPTAAELDPVRELKRQLGRAQFLEHVDTALAERALGQLDTLVDRRKHVRELLRRKFEQEELTYGRYSEATDRAMAAVMENLKEAASIFGRLDSLQLDTLPAAAKSAATPEEAKAFSDRAALGAKMLADVRGLMARNETALTEFDKIASALAEVKTSKDGGTLDFDQVMLDLNDLAQRAKNYSL